MGLFSPWLFGGCAIDALFVVLFSERFRKMMIDGKNGRYRTACTKTGSWYILFLYIKRGNKNRFEAFISDFFFFLVSKQSFMSGW